MMEFDFEPLRREIHAAGFFATPSEDMGTWRRIAVSSKKIPGRGYTGNSFWLTNFNGIWYAGTWGTYYYRLPDADRVVDLCVAWFTRHPDRTHSHFDDLLQKEFDLVPVSDDEFERVITNS